MPGWRGLRGEGIAQLHPGVEGGGYFLAFRLERSRGLAAFQYWHIQYVEACDSVVNDEMHYDTSGSGMMGGGGSEKGQIAFYPELYKYC